MVQKFGELADGLQLAQGKGKRGRQRGAALASHRLHAKLFGEHWREPLTGSRVQRQTLSCLLQLAERQLLEDYFMHAKGISSVPRKTVDELRCFLRVE